MAGVVLLSSLSKQTSLSWELASPLLIQGDSAQPERGRVGKGKSKDMRKMHKERASGRQRGKRSKQRKLKTRFDTMAIHSSRPNVIFECGQKSQVFLGLVLGV